MFNNSFKVALAQIGAVTDLFKISEQEKKIEKMITRASNKGAEIICFPELSYIDGSLLEEIFGGVCRKNKIWAIFGAIGLNKEDKKANCAFLMDRKGKIMHTYCKQHLLKVEKKEYNAGDKAGIFDTDFGRIGIMICYDMFSVNVIVGYAEQNIDIIFCPSLMVVPIPELINYQRNIVLKILPHGISVLCKTYFGLAMTAGSKLIAESKMFAPLGSLKANNLSNDQEAIVYGEIKKDDLEILRQI